MRYYLLVETAAGSGQFELSGSNVSAASASLAITAVTPLAPQGVRVGVWPYRAMAGVPTGGAADGEVGAGYLVIEQTGGTAGSFVLTTDEIDSSADLDAGVAAVRRQDSTGLRTGLMPKPVAGAPAAQSTATTNGNSASAPAAAAS